jgi:hypothetical protein
VKGTLIGSSHIYFLTENWQNCLQPWKQSNKWDTDNFFGHTICPIYAKSLIDSVTLNYKKGNIIYLFTHRSVGYNVLHEWMDKMLNENNCQPVPGELLRDARKKAHGGVDKKHLHDDAIIDKQNKFYKMWLDWYIQTFPNIKFVFWCHFGFNELSGRTNPPHITYSELYDEYKDNAIDLMPLRHDDKYKDIVRDGDHHPSLYGYDKIRQILEEDMKK